MWAEKKMDWNPDTVIRRQSMTSASKTFYIITSALRHSLHMLFLSIAYLASKAHCRTFTDVITLGEKAHKLFPTNSVSVTISQGHSNCDHAMHYQHALSERHSKVQRLSRSLSKPGDVVTSNAPLKDSLPFNWPSDLTPHVRCSLELRLDRPVHLRINSPYFERASLASTSFATPLRRFSDLFRIVSCIPDCAFPFHYATPLIVILLCLCHLRLYFVYKYSLYSPMFSFFPHQNKIKVFSPKRFLASHWVPLPSEPYILRTPYGLLPKSPQS